MSRDFTTKTGGELSGVDSARVQLGGKQRLGSISKQGNRFMRMLMVEAAQIAVRYDPGFRNEYLHRCHTKAKGVAKVGTEEVGDSTVLDAANEHRVSGGRSCREQLARWPWSAQARLR